jgi:hypothetical protein
MPRKFGTARSLANRAGGYVGRPDWRQSGSENFLARRARARIAGQ